jgi:Trm5-related predicted tRNA methylase
MSKNTVIIDEIVREFMSGTPIDRAIKNVMSEKHLHARGELQKQARVQAFEEYLRREG